MKPNRLLQHLLPSLGSSLLAASSLHAASGTWITDGSSTWSTGGNWSGGTIADGTDANANFILNITGNNLTKTVTLDSSRNIGNITKTDTVISNTALVIDASGGSILTLATSSGTPTITNTDAGGASRLDISAQLSSTQGLTKAGAGIVYLANNSSSWSGATTISNGLLHLGGVNVANIGGGSGRNISVASGAGVGFNALSNAILNRIVETTDEISVMTSTTSNAFDFSSSTGATLTGAFLGTYASGGNKAELSGIITMTGAYRLGAPGLNSGTLGIRQASLLSGSNGLIIGGNRVEIVGTHSFTGDTVIRDGARLGLAGLNTDVGTAKNHSLGLQNSVLDLGAPSATGQIFLEAGIGGQVLDSTTLANGGTTSATFGGLKGSRNLNSAFLFTNPGNNTAAAVATAITGFTLNVGTGKTATYTGAIGGFGAGASGGLNGASTLTKTGEGKQILGGVNTYTGVTSVNGGALEIAAGGSTAAGSAVSVSNSGSALVVNGTVNGTLTANVSTTISGTGTIVGNATISGTHNPGNSPGIQTFSGDLAYTGGSSVVNWELSDNTITNAPNPNAVFDQIVVGGTLNFAGATTLNLLFAGGSVLWADSLWDTDQSWTLYDVTTETTNFSNLSLGSINWLDSGSNLFSTTGGSFALSQVGNDVMINYTIPEPNAAALIGGFGVLALLRRRRR